MRQHVFTVTAVFTSPTPDDPDQPAESVLMARQIQQLANAVLTFGGRLVSISHAMAPYQSSPPVLVTTALVLADLPDDLTECDLQAIRASTNGI